MPEMVPVMWTPWLWARIVFCVLIFGLLVRALYVRTRSLLAHRHRGLSLMIRQDRLARAFAKIIQFLSLGLGLLYTRFYIADPLERTQVGDALIAIALFGLLLVLLIDFYFMHAMEREDRAGTG